MKPLKPSEFQILLSLAGGVRHGLGIVDEILDVTDGAVRIGPATLYRALQQLSDRGLIEAAAAPAGEDDPRRRFYAITQPGRERVAAEAERLRSLVDFARQNRVLGDGGG